MRKIFISIFLVLCCLFSAAQNSIQVKLWAGENGEIVNEKPVLKSWIPAEEITEATLTIYPAKNPNGQAVIACPGGGYAGIAVTHEGHDMANWFNAQGITYAVLHYRMPNEKHEIPLGDAHQAIRYMRKHAEKWHIQQLGITGSSAGGHLASTAATHFMDDTRLDFQILFYPVITMKEYTHQGSKKNLLGKEPNEELVNLYSNELQVKSQTPPAFIMHSSDDKVVPVCNSVNYYMALTDKGILSSLHLYPIGGHGWGFGDNFIYKRQWTGELEKWLREIKNKQ